MKVLVIQQKMIGDVLASTVICQNLKAHFAGSEVYFLVNEHTTDVVLQNPDIDHLLVFKNEYRKDWGQFRAFLKGIRELNFDVVIDVYGKTESNIITYFSKAPTRISYRKWYTRWLYTHLFDYATKASTPMGLAIENRLLLLSPLVPKATELEGTPRIYLTEEEKDAGTRYLKENKIDMDAPVIMVSVQGSSEIKSYPKAYMASLLNTVVHESRGTVLLNYHPEQENAAAKIYELCEPGVRDHIRFDLKPGSLRFFLTVLYSCTALFGNEGGTMNMAKALGVPTFSIFSPWISKEAWDTYNDNPKNRAVHLSDFMPQLTADHDQDSLKKRAAELYDQFKPDYIRDELIEFLKLEGISNQ